jgi:hypothetical protein
MKPPRDYADDPEPWHEPLEARPVGFLAIAGCWLAYFAAIGAILFIGWIVAGGAA